MNNPVLIGAKLNLKRSSLTTVETKITELMSKRSELETAIDGVESEEDFAALETQVAENDQAISATEEEKSSLEAEIAELESKLEELNRKKPNKGEKRNMTNQIETREAINAYVRSKGAYQERGFTSVDGGALIPEELLTPKKALEDVVDLTKYVNIVKVNSGSGKYPVIKKSGTKMSTVAELAANPELAKPTITEVQYDIDTYRGYIPVSQEVIDDADYDVTGMISDEIQDQELNTKNSAIAAILKTATAKAVTGADGLITLLNKDLKQVYNTKLYVSASLYNELDLLKDGNGRYLMQDDITSSTGKRFKGREVVVLDDDVIGTTAGNLVGFVGDAKEFVTLFDRKAASVKWIDNEVYGQLLAGYVRFDTVKVDNEAGFYITYTAEPAGA